MSESGISQAERDGLRRLLATEEIRQLTVKYSHYRDGLHLEKLVNLFAPEGVCDFGQRFGGVVAGHDAIRRHFEKSMKTNGGLPFATVHAISTHYLAFVSEDRAEGRCFLIDFISQDRDNPLKYVIIYDDAYVRIDGAWKFAQRTLEMVWPHNDATRRLPGDA
jgi:hypothetical protein